MTYKIKKFKKTKPLPYHLVFLKDGTNYVCQCITRTKDHNWRKDTLEI